MNSILNAETRVVFGLVEGDIRDLGILVERVSPNRLMTWEPLGYKAPSIARPYCCYISTVIFYVYPHVVVQGGKLRGNFQEWDRVDCQLIWDTRFQFEGGTYKIGGGRVVRRNGRWWMRREARLVPSKEGTAP